jgi:hypothetical protein
VGLAFTVAPVVALKPVEGLHAYVAPPLAVRFTFPPVQMVGFAGTILIVGRGLTVTVTCEVEEHPLCVTVSV